MRKIFITGNSLVISLPKESIELLGLRKGSEVPVVLNQHERRIISEPANFKLTDIDPEFAQQVNEFIAQYRSALEALAK